MRAAARKFRLDHAKGDFPAAAVALMRTVRESVFWNYIISLEARLPVDSLPGSISDDGYDSDSVGDDETSTAEWESSASAQRARLRMFPITRCRHSFCFADTVLMMS